MGVLSGKDIFSSKWITAEIIDSSNRLWYVPIKYTIGDYFLADINRQLYCFKIEGSRILTHKNTLTRSFHVLQYTTKHYMPISSGDNHLLDELRLVNSLPKIDGRLFGLLKIFANKEKILKPEDKFEPHVLQNIVDEATEKGPKYEADIENLKNYLDHLGIEKIITPTKQITEFLEGDLLATDPKFLGDVTESHQRMDEEHKKVANLPVTGKTAWAKILIVMILIGAIIGIGYFVISSGMLDNLVPKFGNPVTGGQASTSNDIMSRYPTPQSLKAACDRGEVDCKSLPKNIQDWVAKAQPLIATPNK